MYGRSAKDLSDPWRLIPYSRHNAAVNMAIDEAILDCHIEGRSPPTLRLYGWQPSAVSIGYAQRLSESAERRIRQRGFDIVRRPTGGRAVLHANELTYSFIGSANIGAPSDQVLGDSVIGAYKLICQGLILAFKRLGVELCLGLSDREYRNQHDCFLATTSADLHYQGKKMIGSAQLRRRHGILQHGSILLDQRQDQMRSLLADDDADSISSEDDTKSVDGKRHANLFDIISEPLTIESLQDALKCGFESAFGRTFIHYGLHDYESAMSLQHRTKYEAPAFER